MYSRVGGQRVIAERESDGRHFVIRTPLEGDPHAQHDPDGEGVSSNGGEHLGVPTPGRCTQGFLSNRNTRTVAPGVNLYSPRYVAPGPRS
jgi:hypothetical protein